MNLPPSIVDEVEFELVLEDDLPIIEGEVVTDDPEVDRLNREADRYEALSARLDLESYSPSTGSAQLNTPRSESFRVWMAEGEALRAQVALESALKNLSEARAAFVLATTPPSIKPVI
jgi:hypothetical protein